MEQGALDYLLHHQKEIRSDLYQGIADALAAGDNDASSFGRRIILPASYHGGERFMFQLFQDSIAITRHFGKPTCL